MAANDALGQCEREPCIGPIADFTVPAQWKNGNIPPPVTPETYGGSGSGQSAAKTSYSPAVEPKKSYSAPASTCASVGEQCLSNKCCDASAICKFVKGDGIQGQVCTASMQIYETSSCAQEGDYCSGQRCCDARHKCGKVDNDGKIGDVCYL
jgi:hypothetical protein